ncbi:PAS/PAC sensor hybrid histidine kinase [Chitinispirillum alkaliphilum]|nr:PAS/PAC sensor hybrid histidine kinase [Chitinispirillum alkaliphilum]
MLYNVTNAEIILFLFIGIFLIPVTIIWIFIYRKYKKTEKALLEKSRELDSFFSSSRDLLCIADLHGNIKRINKEWETTLGYRHVDVQDHKFFEFIHPEDLQNTISAIDSLRNNKQLLNFVNRFRAKDGCYRSIEWRSVSHESMIYASARDVTEQLRERESLLLTQYILDRAPDSCIWLDDEANVIYVNQKACISLGYTKEELLSKKLFDIDPCYSSSQFVTDKESLKQKKSMIFETTHRTKAGVDFPVEVSVNYFEYKGKFYSLTFDRDLTERKKAEEQRKRIEQKLNQVQRIQSLGILAGGIAHDFNNILSGLFGFIDLALMQSNDSSVNKNLSNALSAIERARGLSSQLLTFSKGGEPIRRPEDLFPFVKDTVQFALSGSNVSCTFSSEKLHTCNIDKNQIGQVINNLTINALQAMPGGGVLSITAKNVLLREDQNQPLPNGLYVQLSFSDTGTGIPEEKLPHIFDPFYTTKPNGHGLGLSTCYSIIHRHGGSIEVESETGKGTTFKVLLPATNESPTITDPEQRVIHKGSGIFIIMDDEEFIRYFLSRIIESFGYTVLCAKNGKEAIDLYTETNKKGKKVRSMIFDLTVPNGMGGYEAIQEIRKADPETPVFVSSGYADDPIMANPRKYGFTASICKPCQTNELAQILDECLI